MDPNANLIEQERILDALADFVVPMNASTENGHRRRLRELRRALKGWIGSGGFAPEWVKAPRASVYFGQ